MILEQGLVTHLLTISNLTAIIGARIYPLMMPQHAGGEPPKVPSLVYQRISVQRQPLVCTTDKTAQGAVLINAYAVNYAAVKALAEQVRLALIDFKGMMGDVEIKGCFLDTETDLEDIEPGLYRVAQTWTIWFVES